MLVNKTPIKDPVRKKSGRARLVLNGGINSRECILSAQTTSLGGRLEIRNDKSELVETFTLGDALKVTITGDNLNIREGRKVAKVICQDNADALEWSQFLCSSLFSVPVSRRPQQPRQSPKPSQSSPRMRAKKVMDSAVGRVGSASVASSDDGLGNPSLIEQTDTSSIGDNDGPLADYSNITALKVPASKSTPMAPSPLSTKQTSSPTPTSLTAASVRKPSIINPSSSSSPAGQLRPKVVNDHSIAPTSPSSQPTNEESKRSTAPPASSQGSPMSPFMLPPSAASAAASTESTKAAFPLSSDNASSDIAVRISQYESKGKGMSIEHPSTVAAVTPPINAAEPTATPGKTAEPSTPTATASLESQQQPAALSVRPARLSVSFDASVSDTVRTKVDMGRLGGVGAGPPISAQSSISSLSSMNSMSGVGAGAGAGMGMGVGMGMGMGLSMGMGLHSSSSPTTTHKKTFSHAIKSLVSLTSATSGASGSGSDDDSDNECGEHSAEVSELKHKIRFTEGELNKLQDLETNLTSHMEAIMDAKTNALLGVFMKKSRELNVQYSHQKDVLVNSLRFQRELSAAQQEQELLELSVAMKHELKMAERLFHEEVSTAKESSKAEYTKRIDDVMAKIAAKEVELKQLQDSLKKLEPPAPVGLLRAMPSMKSMRVGMSDHRLSTKTHASRQASTVSSSSASRGSKDEQTHNITGVMKSVSAAVGMFFHRSKPDVKPLAVTPALAAPQPKPTPRNPQSMAPQPVVPLPVSSTGATPLSPLASLPSTMSISPAKPGVVDPASPPLKGDSTAIQHADAKSLSPEPPPAKILDAVIAPVGNRRRTSTSSSVSDDRTSRMVSFAAVSVTGASDAATVVDCAQPVPVPVSSKPQRTSIRATHEDLQRLMDEFQIISKAHEDAEVELMTFFKEREQAVKDALTPIETKFEARRQVELGELKKVVDLLSESPHFQRLDEKQKSFEIGKVHAICEQVIKKIAKKSKKEKKAALDAIAADFEPLERDFRDALARKDVELAEMKAKLEQVEAQVAEEEAAMAAEMAARRKKRTKRSSMKDGGSFGSSGDETESQESVHYQKQTHAKVPTDEKSRPQLKINASLAQAQTQTPQDGPKLSARQQQLVNEAKLQTQQQVLQSPYMTSMMPNSSPRVDPFIIPNPQLSHKWGEILRIQENQAEELKRLEEQLSKDQEQETDFYKFVTKPAYKVAEEEKINAAKTNAAVDDLMKFSIQLYKVRETAAIRTIARIFLKFHKNLAAEKANRQAIREFASSIVIQSCVRMFLAKRKLLFLRRKKIKKQKMFMKKYEDKKRNYATVVIQSAARMYLARRMFKRLARELIGKIRSRAQYIVCNAIHRWVLSRNKVVLRYEMFLGRLLKAVLKKREHLIFAAAKAAVARENRRSMRRAHAGTVAPKGLTNKLASNAVQEIIDSQSIVGSLSLISKSIGETISLPFQSKIVPIRSPKNSSKKTLMESVLTSSASRRAESLIVLQKPVVEEPKKFVIPASSKSSKDVRRTIVFKKVQAARLAVDAAVMMQRRSIAETDEEEEEEDEDGQSERASTSNGSVVERRDRFVSFHSDSAGVSPLTVHGTDQYQ